MFLLIGFCLFWSGVFLGLSSPVLYRWLIKRAMPHGRYRHVWSSDLDTEPMPVYRQRPSSARWKAHQVPSITKHTPTLEMRLAAVKAKIREKEACQ